MALHELVVGLEASRESWHLAQFPIILEAATEIYKHLADMSNSIIDAEFFSSTKLARATSFASITTFLMTRSGRSFMYMKNGKVHITDPRRILLQVAPGEDQA